MYIGMTYDLRSEHLAQGMSLDQVAEFDSDETIQAIEDELAFLGPPSAVDRIGGCRRLVERLAAGDRWDLVFNIAEGLYGLGREALVPALLDAYRIPYVFSDPLVLALTLDKGMAKRVVRDHGHAHPGFRRGAGARGRQGRAPGLPPVRQARGRGHGQGRDRGLAHQQRRGTGRGVPRPAGPVRPARSGGGLPARPRVHRGHRGHGRRGAGPGRAWRWHLLEQADAGVYTQRNKEECESLVQYRLAHDAQPEEARSVALAAWRGLGCRDGGRVDVRQDGRARACFIEVNPLAGLHPSHSDLPILAGLAGISYRELMSDIMGSALGPAWTGTGRPYPGSRLRNAALSLAGRHVR